MGEFCTEDNKASKIRTGMEFKAYQAAVINALDLLLGRASNQRLRTVKETRAGILGKPFIKRLKNDISKHLTMYNPDGIDEGNGGILYDFLMENGMQSNFEADPLVRVEELRDYLHDKMGVPVDWTLFFSKYGISSSAVHKHIQRIIKAGEGFSPKARAFMPISVFTRADRFGYVGRLARRMKTLTDRTRQDSNPYVEDYGNHVEWLQNYIGNLIGEGVLTLNNGAMNGLRPRDGFYTVDGREVVLHKETADGYVVSYVVDDVFQPIRDVFNKLISQSSLEKVIIPKHQLDVSQDRINEALVEKYTSNFVNNLTHGQIRKIVWKTIPSDKTTNWKKTDSDGKIIKRKILPKMAKGEFAPDVYDAEVVIGGQKQKIKYIIIKQGQRDEQGNIDEAATAGEIYHAYILESTTPAGKKTKLYDTGYDDKLLVQTMGKSSVTGASAATKVGDMNGYYRTDRHENNGYKFGRTWGHITGSGKTAVRHGFNKMARQPHNFVDDIVDLTDDALMPEDKWQIGLPNLLRKIREINNSVADKFQEKTLMAQQYLEQAHDRFLGVYQPKFYAKAIEEWDNLDSKEKSKWQNKKQYSTYQAEIKAEEQWQELMSIGNMHLMSWIDERGGIHTPNSYFQRMQSNYGTAMYSYSEMGFMLDEALQSLNSKLKDAKTDGEIAILETQIAGIENVRRKHASNYKDVDKREQIIADMKGVFAKQRSQFTDLTRRRKDGDVLPEYVEKLFRGIHRNILLSEVVDTMERMDRWGKPEQSKGLMDWTVNAAKKTLNDPDYDAMIGSADLSNRNVASWFNSIAKKFGYEGKWDAESAQRFVLTSNGLTSMRFLGMFPAMGNRTQIVNPMIKYGWDNVSKAMKLHDTPQWIDIVNNTGVTNTVSMFNDIMLAGGDSSLTDAGIVTNPLIGLLSGGLTKSVPTGNLWNFGKLIRMGRENFIKGIAQSSEQKDMINGISDSLARMKEGNKALIKTEYTGRAGKEIEELRRVWWDLLTQGSEADEAITRQRIKFLTDEVREGTLKRMIAWKLSWAFGMKEGGSAASWITFTGGELALRSQTVISALLFADSLGLLGSKTNDDTMGERTVTTSDGQVIKYRPNARFFSPAAVRIARAAVYAQQFGMSQIFLGDGLGGLGRAIGQYKAYPIQQQIHDNDIFSNWWDKPTGIWAGGGNRLNSIERLVAEATNQIKKGSWDRVIGRRKKKSEITDVDVDREAIAVLRLLSTRIAASVMASLVEVAPAIMYPARLAIGYGGVGMMRSAEQPMIGMAVRAIILAATLSADGGDDDDFNDLFKLFLPPVISWFVMFLLNLDDVFE